MRILQVSDAFYPDVDGPIEVMVNIAKEFKNKNLGEADLLVPHYPQKVEIGGLKIYRCKSIPTGGYRGCVPSVDRRVRKLFSPQALRNKYDLIHLHSPFPLAKFALKAAKKSGVPVVITVHTKFEDELKNRIKVKFIRNFVMRYLLKTISGCDRITCVSRGMKDTLYRYGYHGNADIQVIYNSANVISSNAEKAAALRAKLKSVDGFAFIFVGRLVKVKNVQFSLEVLSLVKSRGYNNFKFYIVGDGEYGKVLRKLAFELGLEENVEFLGRITDKDRLSEYYAACDVLLFPSVFDNSSITIMEAAINGLPSVTVKYSDSAERIIDNKNGFAWDYDVNVWAHNLIQLMQNGEKLKKVGEGAKNTLYLSPESVAAQYDVLYRETIEKFNRHT